MVSRMVGQPFGSSRALVLTIVVAGVLSEGRAGGSEGYDPFAADVSTLALRGDVSDSAMGSTIGGDISYLRAWGGVEGELGVTRLPGTAIDIAILGRLGRVGRSHALTLGLGPRVVVSSSYGAFAALQTELAYEYRPAGALGVLLGVGPFKVYGNPHVSRCDGPAECPRLKEFGVRFRLSVGHTF
jgi:hypothetical protein